MNTSAGTSTTSDDEARSFVERHDRRLAENAARVERLIGKPPVQNCALGARCCGPCGSGCHDQCYGLGIEVGGSDF